MVEPIPEFVYFSREGGKVLEYWKKIDAFKSSLKLFKGKRGNANQSFGSFKLQISIRLWL
jgi:hypothetical protein